LIYLFNIQITKVLEIVIARIDSIDIQLARLNFLQFSELLVAEVESSVLSTLLEGFDILIGLQAYETLNLFVT